MPRRKKEQVVTNLTVNKWSLGYWLLKVKKVFKKGE